MDSDSDAYLVARLAADDGIALKQLFALHSFEVYGYARSLVRRHDDAQEVVQQTYLTMWESRRRLTTYVGSALPWLLVTARNHARNLLRTRGRHEARFVDLEGAGDLASDETPEATVLAQEATEELNAALAALQPIEREIFELCIADDLLYKQAAVQLGITHGAVRNRLSRVRRQLQVRLGPQNGAAND